MHRGKVWGGSLVAMALLAVLLWLLSPAPGHAQAGITNFESVVLAGDLLVGDDGTFGGSISVNDLTAVDFVNITAQSVITLTSDATLTPTGSLQRIASAGAVGIDGGTNIEHVTDYLILVNTGAQTITFTETTGLISAGNLALGAGDSATLVWVNGGWVQIAASNN